MFKHLIAPEDSRLALAFVRSANVKVFPCGRRRSTEGEGMTNIPHIPYDPEAKLNTEANNLKHSSLNGYTQSYLLQTWPENDTASADSLSLVLGGYLFQIQLDQDYCTAANFGKNLVNFLNANSADSTAIYANIRLEEIPLYQGINKYTTYILRNQTDTGEPSATLDMLVSDTDNAINTFLKENPNEAFYFSGLSFSTVPLTGEPDNTKTVSETTLDANSTRGRQRVISLRILDRGDSEADWEVNQFALLPEISHGRTANSISVGTIYLGDAKVPSLTLIPVENKEDTYQLKFSFGSNTSNSY